VNVSCTNCGKRYVLSDDKVAGKASVKIRCKQCQSLISIDVAQAASDFVLQGGGLLPLAEAVPRARLAQRVAAQNIGFAFVYNIIAVPVAILGFATPLIAALVMASSSLLVITNALRLGRGIR
jgi:Cu2+-exporting ATPase